MEIHIYRSLVAKGQIKCVTVLYCIGKGLGFLFLIIWLRLFCLLISVYLQETERLREAAVKFLISALSKEDSQQGSSGGIISLCSGLEAEIFNLSKKLVNNKYRKLSRKVIFGLQSQERRSELVSGRLSVREFVSQYL